MDIALVPGSYHGAWCWDLLRPELERLGHRVITTRPAERARMLDALGA